MVKLLYTGHLMWRSDLLEKTLMLGKTEGKRRSGRQRMRWLDGLTNLMDMNLSKLYEIVEDRDLTESVFSVWLISLSTVPSWSILVTNGMVPFFFRCSPTTSSLSMHLSMGIQVVSMPWLLWTTLQQAWKCRCLRRVDIWIWRRFSSTINNLFSAVSFLCVCTRVM